MARNPLETLVASQQVREADLAVEEAIRLLRTASSLYAKADLPIFATRFASVSTFVKEEASR